MNFDRRPSRNTKERFVKATAGHRLAVLFSRTHRNANGSTDASTNRSSTDDQGVSTPSPSTGANRVISKGVLLAVIASAMLASSAAAAAVEPESSYVADVTSSSATILSTVDPEGAATTYRFDYGTTTGYGHSGPSPEGNAGDTSTSIPVVLHLQDLSPATTYHYRAVVTSLGIESPGPDRSFTTQPAAGASVLADGRAWELVSPVNKHGAGLEPISKEGGVIEASESGNAITYIATSPPVENPEGNTALEYQQTLSIRDDAGWSTQDIISPNETISELIPGEFAEYPLFSPDLSRGLLQPKGDTPLPPLEPGAEKTLYLRDTATGAYKALVTAENVVTGAHFGETANQNVLEAVGGSSDLSHVLISSGEVLTPDAAKDAVGDRNLYEWAGGELALASILPPNSLGEELPATALEENSLLGLGNRLVRNAVSDDGSRVVFSTMSFVGETVHGEFVHLYLRDVGKHETVRLDVPDTGEETGIIDGPLYQGASSDGQRVFFTDEQRLTPDSHAAEGMPDLYAFDVTTEDGHLGGHVTDLSRALGAEEAANVRGTIAGYSRDGSDVYFVASGSLAGGVPPGANLYMEHYAAGSWEEPVLVASLSSSDGSDWSQEGSQDLAFLTARVSPNGQFMAFMSDRPLTGYDNRNADGEPEQEVFLYDAQTNHVSCASCDPTGARPIGIFDSRAQAKIPWVDHTGASLGWISGNIPGWTAYSAGKALYQSRYLSDSGRLFFNSADGLVPADVNGREDVYEYEPTGAACNESTSGGSEIYIGSASGSGCVALLSSGSSSDESAFIDASESGDDVFFLTTSRLTALDVDSAYDVYDAHVCSLSSPCTSAAAKTFPCSDAESCRPAASEGSRASEAPSTAFVTGEGNVERKRKRGLSRALERCKKIRVRSQRRTCEQKARHHQRRHGAIQRSANAFGRGTK